MVRARTFAHEDAKMLKMLNEVCGFLIKRSNQAHQLPTSFLSTGKLGKDSIKRNSLYLITGCKSESYCRESTHFSPSESEALRRRESYLAHMTHILATKLSTWFIEGRTIYVHNPPAMKPKYNLSQYKNLEEILFEMQRFQEVQL